MLLGIQRTYGQPATSIGISHKPLHRVCEAPGPIVTGVNQHAVDVISNELIRARTIGKTHCGKTMRQSFDSGEAVALIARRDHIDLSRPIFRADVSHGSGQFYPSVEVMPRNFLAQAVAFGSVAENTNCPAGEFAKARMRVIWSFCSWSRPTAMMRP